MFNVCQRRCLKSFYFQFLSGNHIMNTFLNSVTKRINFMLLLTVVVIENQLHVIAKLMTGFFFHAFHRSCHSSCYQVDLKYIGKKSGCQSFLIKSILQCYFQYCNHLHSLALHLNYLTFLITVPVLLSSSFTTFSVLSDLIHLLSHL